MRLLLPFSNDPKIRDLIIVVLSENQPLTAKKIHNGVKKHGRSVSFQSVHKALKYLIDNAVVKKYERDYYINSEWLTEMNNFITKLQERTNIKKEIPVEKSFLDYSSYKLNIKPIRFTPFYLGKKNKITPHVKFLKSKDCRVFLFNNAQYYWFQTGVCVQCYFDRPQKVNVVDFLVHRRRTHLSILSNRTKFAKDIHYLQNNNDSLSPIYYVMSIHHVDFDSLLALEQLDNLLFLMSKPEILGIHDNPKLTVTDEIIYKARKSLKNFDSAVIDDSNVFDMSPSKSVRFFATWSNVVLCSKDTSLLEQLISQEVKLQHLWYLFYHMKQKNQQDIDIKTIMTLWQNFSETEAEAQHHILKEGLIKTSKIKTIYNELMEKWQKR